MSTPDDPFRPRPPREGDPAPYAPPQGYGQPAYGTPPPGWAQPYGPPETSSRAVVALVLAIGSFVVLPLVLAIAALVVAGGASREIDASGGRLTGRGLVTGARVTAWVNIALSVVVLLLLVVLVALASSGAVSGTLT